MALPKYQQSILDTGAYGTMLTAPAPAPAQTFGQGFAPAFAEAMTVAGPLVSIFGAANAAVGSYYAAQS